MIVLDASAVVDMLLATSRRAEILQRITQRSETLHAPQLLDLEVVQVLRRYQTAGLVKAARAQEAMDCFVGLEIVHYGHRDLLPRIWELRDNLTAYDAAYVAVAEVLGATLLTTDRKLAKTTGHTARIECVR